MAAPSGEIESLLRENARPRKLMNLTESEAAPSAVIAEQHVVRDL